MIDISLTAFIKIMDSFYYKSFHVYAEIIKFSCAKSI